jgi:hypothetical protein
MECVRPSPPLLYSGTTLPFGYVSAVLVGNTKAAAGPPHSIKKDRLAPVLEEIR